MLHDRAVSIIPSARAVSRARVALRARIFAWAMIAIVISMTPSLSLANPITVSGRVTEHLTGDALGGIRVSIWYQDPYLTQEVGSTTTAADGSYAWSGACHFIVFLPSCRVSIDDERYLYANTWLYADTTTITKNFVLTRPATITGDIRINGATPANAVGVSISYYEDIYQGWTSPQTTYQEENGHYVIGRIPPDVPYRLCAAGLGHGAIEQCFDHHDRASLTEDPAYDLVTVGEGVQRNGIDFDLKPGGSIQGTLHDGYLGVPLANTQLVIQFFDETGVAVTISDSFSDANGHYHFDGLPDGSFYIEVWIDGPFIDAVQLYPGIVCDEGGWCPPAINGQRLSISGGSSITSIDFTVHPMADSDTIFRNGFEA